MYINSMYISIDLLTIYMYINSMYKSIDLLTIYMYMYIYYFLSIYCNVSKPFCQKKKWMKSPSFLLK